MAQELSALDYLTRTVDRNRYFYGKLMTVRDFLREQEYFNSKRWLINRLLFGSGIVCGLEVTAGGGGAATTVEIAPGMAIDPLGREITVVATERVDLANLAMPPGPAAPEKTLLVCLTYHECPKEPIPSLKGSPCDESCESNRIGETFTVGLIPAPPDAQPPSPCERWLNRQTVSRQTADFDVERVAPVWVRAGETFEVAVKVTARRVVSDAQLNEAVAGGDLIQPTPNPPQQFPTPPVYLQPEEFFVYVYQVRASAGGAVNISGAAGTSVPVPATSIEIVTDDEADSREATERLGCDGDPAQTCVPIARVRAVFNGATLSGVEVLDQFEQQRFRYNLSRLAELLDCVRTSLHAESGSSRPGHAFITFKELENNDLQPVGPANATGQAFTVTRADHVHALLLRDPDSGLEFQGNRLRINGKVGGEAIEFLNTVSGVTPTSLQHLATKGYVDSTLAGLDWQESVLSRKLTAPPDNPQVGNRYLILAATGMRNPWSKHVDAIATWNGKDWDYAPASGKQDEGTAVFVEDEQIAYLYARGADKDSKWIPFLATPSVAAGKGLRADGAILSVGEGEGLRVNEDTVDVVFEKGLPQPVGNAPSAGALKTAAAGDHTHELPIAALGGLGFGKRAADPRPGLLIDGQVGGANIDFRNPVWGQTPTEPRHLATKQYVDGLAIGLDWQNSVLDKDLTMPPRLRKAGARYLILSTSDVIFEPPPPPPPPDSGPVLSSKTEPQESVRDVVSDPDPIPPPPPPTNGGDGGGIVNPWSGHEGSITTWDGSAWTFTPPNEGMAVFVEDENTTYLYADGSWSPFMAMPSVAAGKGLRADGAILSVGEGRGLSIGPDTVDVVYESRAPQTVGPKDAAGTSDTAARGDHTHRLPLAPSGGLEFVAGAVPDPSAQLRINGRVMGDAIDFQFPVLGQDPTDARHLATKQYVDSAVGGLSWQRPVLDKDLTAPPDKTQRGDRYLIFTDAPTGAWAGKAGNIATQGAKTWEFTAPSEGMATFVADENLAYLYVDGKWIQFLAPPATVGAGAGLIQSGGDLAVGQGEGVIVSADAVAVSFGVDAPQSVSANPSAGNSRRAAQSDHTHALLLADLSGLEFISTQFDTSAPSESVAFNIPRLPISKGQSLRINGTIGGDAIFFAYPVSGQEPTDAQHLATKQYVDDNRAGVSAGDGLVAKDNIISVGAGLGLIVDPDEVGVNFSNDAPQPVGQVASPGKLNSAARADHVHAMPDVWGAASATGVVVFDQSRNPIVTQVNSDPINPFLGKGAISVILGLELDLQTSTGIPQTAQESSIFVGQLNQFENFSAFQPVNLGAVVLPSVEGRDPEDSRFQIYAHAVAKQLPTIFRVRWWAFRAGKDLGVTTPGGPPIA